MIISHHVSYKAGNFINIAKLFSGFSKVTIHAIYFKQNGKYFDAVQPHTHHTSSKTGVNVYSFALNPEEHQPSGTCNFSRIDNATLTITTGTVAETYIYAVNYNVLRIMSGMGGLAYSN